MSRRIVRWTRVALRRVEQIGDHIARDDPAAAERVVARLFSTVDALSEQPAMGRSGRIAGTREFILPDPPYVFAYRVKPETVEILIVLHGTQRWPDVL